MRHAAANVLSVLIVLGLVVLAMLGLARQAVDLIGPQVNVYYFYELHLREIFSALLGLLGLLLLWDVTLGAFARLRTWPALGSR